MPRLKFRPEIVDTRVDAIDTLKASNDPADKAILAISTTMPTAQLVGLARLRVAQTTIASRATAVAWLAEHRPKHWAKLRELSDEISDRSLIAFALQELTSDFKPASKAEPLPRRKRKWE